MRKLVYLAAVLLSLAFVFSSCTKNDDNNDDDNNVNTGDKEYLLTQFKMESALVTTINDISYNSDLNLDKIIERENGVVKTVKKYNLNGSLFIDCKWYSDEAMTNPIGSNAYTFNATGELTSMVEINGADTFNYSISWNAGKVSEYVAINNLAPFNDHKSTFEWTGDNITKETTYVRDSTGAFAMFDYRVYTYDDKINPFTVKYIPEVEEVAFYSKNNITKIEYYGPTGVIQSLSQFTYHYDDKDAPKDGTYDFGFTSGLLYYNYSELDKP